MIPYIILNIPQVQMHIQVIMNTNFL